MRATSCLLSLLLLPAIASAGGPRFVTGPPFFTGQQGTPIGWKQPNLLYFTDPGSLSPAVDHASADALVAAAASVWNLPVASITIARGGVLAEHVSGQNAYLDTSGLVFPADVVSANAAAIPIAVLYDTDGSVTDMLLGSGASLPSGCRQNAVTQMVDSFDPAGYILHAIIVLNGRCTGAAPELQLEMQYQLERAFGRVLGLAWSQTNDNVFTGAPTPSYAQAMAWPIMHPLDIICGLYAYQCLPNPFQLRPDDISSMVAVYPVPNSPTLPAGKQFSLNNANAVTGHISFPTGEGMAGVNVLISREPQGGSAFDSYYEASAVTGVSFRSGGRSPFVPADTSPFGSFGSSDPNQAGAYTIAYVPMWPGAPWQNLSITTEPINPLYTGSHSPGPYALGEVLPSGSSAYQQALHNYPWSEAVLDFTIPDASPTCGNGADGTAPAPVPVHSTGWWTGLLCGYGHVSYVETAVTPGRSFTIEVTALDEQGLATESKAMPVIGVFAPTDSPGAIPSLGLTPSAFASTILGMTTISAQTGQLTSLSFGIADERGDGRPDYTYQARFFYADSVIPAELGTAGGNVTISGSGFRAGNAVSINAVAAKVLSWTANTVVLAAPSMAAAQAANGTPVDIVIRDLSTGASSTMTAALTYTTASALPNTMRIVSAQSASVYVGTVAATPFAVQVLMPDGITPVVGDPVTFTTSTGSAQFTSCGGPTCIVLTNAQGIASTGVTPQSAATITMQATDGALTQTASFTALAQTGSLVIWLAPSGNVPVGVVAQTPIALTDLQPNNGGRSPGRQITFTVLTGAATFGGCATAVCTITTDASGSALISVTPTTLGPITIQAADGAVTATTSFTAVTNTDVMTIAQAPSSSVIIDNYSGAFVVNLFLPDGVTPDTNETVTFTGPPGVVFQGCPLNLCTGSTGWSGQAAIAVYATQTGTFTIQANFRGVTQSATFTVVPHTIELRLVSSPSGSTPVGQSTSAPFAVQLLQDGTIPLSGVSLSLAGQSGAVWLDACHTDQSCRLQTDSNGMVSTTVTPLSPGSITLSATYAPYVLSTTFLATGQGQTMTIVQRPAPTVFVGDTISFEVQVIGPGGLAPMRGDLVEFAIASGPFGFSDWSTLSLYRQADGNGDAFEVGVPWAAGPITLIASDGLVSQTFNFTAIARPDIVQIISAPTSGIPAGAVAAVPFAVQVLANDGVSPLASRSVTVSVTSGAASFAGCNGAATCQIVTDAQGMISTAVTPLSAGTITLLATEGGVQQSISFTAVPGALPPQLSIVALNPAVYIASGAAISLPLNAIATYNSLPATNQGVQWTLASGFAAAATNTVTNSSGSTSEAAILGPLVPGAHAVASACAWGSICAQFDGFGVDVSAETITVVSGAAQSVVGGAPLNSVVITVVDGAGHAVAAAQVSVYQTASAFVKCPTSGRCPAAVILASRATVELSGIDGSITITPLVIPGTATQTDIALSVGTQGFATVVAIAQP